MIPKSFTPGENIDFELSYPDQEGWTATFVMVGPEKLEIVGVESPAGTFTFTADPTESDIASGRYQYQVVATLGSNPITNKLVLATGITNVLPDLTKLDSLDTTPWPCKVLSQIEDMITGTAKKNVSTYSVDGRSLSKYSIDELLKLYSRFQSECNSAISKQDGKSTFRRLQFRFRDGNY